MEPLLTHRDPEAAADVAAALRAIAARNYHLLHDRDETGRLRRVVRASDRGAA